MALVEKKAGTSLILRVENGTSASGKTMYANRTVSDINAEMANADFYAIANGLAGLLTASLNKITRKDLIDLAEN